jgi:hypothetical protein
VQCMAPPLPPPMPDWSPVRAYGGYQSPPQAGAMHCTCGVHGHDHTHAWIANIPISQDQEFWGALGCSCWAF